MKNKGKIRILTALFAVVLCMAAFPLTAFAGGGPEGEAEPPAESTTEPETPATINPVALTPDGNLTLVDDIDEQQEGESLKQFITVVTKDGNYFYIIIDRVGDKENVYFLNMVDEADLLALIEDMDTTTTPPTTVAPKPQPDPEPEPAEPEPEAEEKGGGMGGILLIVIVLAAGGGAFYYFKILKPKQAVQGGTDLSELDELDFDDDYLDTGDTGAEDNTPQDEDDA